MRVELPPVSTGYRSVTDRAQPHGGDVGRLAEGQLGVVASVVLVVLTRYLVWASCDLSGGFQLVGEGGRGQAAERRVGSIVVAVGLSGLDAGAGVAHGQEPRGVEALLPQPAVERFGGRVVAGLFRAGRSRARRGSGRRAGRAGARRARARCRPGCFWGGLGSPGAGRTPRRPRSSLEASPRSGPERLSRVAVHDGQDPEGSAVEELVGHEVHGPDIVGAAGLLTARSVAAGPLAARGPGPDRQALLAAELGDALVVHSPALALEKHVEAQVSRGAPAPPRAPRAACAAAPVDRIGIGTGGLTEPRRLSRRLRLLEDGAYGNQNVEGAVPGRAARARGLDGA